MIIKKEVVQERQRRKAENKVIKLKQKKKRYIERKEILKTEY